MSVLTRVAKDYNFRGTMHADLVFCRSGRVTDVQVKEQLPQNLVDFVIATIGMTTFTPAELNFHTVSQRTQYVLSIGDDINIRQIEAAQAENRLVEEVDVVGNRRMDKEAILKYVKTRPGDVYRQAQVEKDLAALLRSGYFNKLNTRTILEDGPRGEVRVTLEVNELPLIGQISVVRNKPMANAMFNDFVMMPERHEILNELARRKVDLQLGRPFDPMTVIRAVEVIEAYYRSHGWANVKVDASVENLMSYRSHVWANDKVDASAENLMSTEIKLTFRVYGKFF